MVIMQERPQEKKETDVQKNRGKTPDQFPSHFLSSGLQIPLLWTLWRSALYEFVPASRANEHSPGDGDPHWDQWPFVGVQGGIKHLKAGNGCSDSKN